MIPTTFDQSLGIRETAKSEGQVTAELMLDSHHKNVIGNIHGGVCLVLLDTVMGHAVNSLLRPGTDWAATTQLSVQFLRGADRGAITGSGRVTRMGKRSAFVEGTVTDEEGNLLARAQGVWAVRQGDG